MDIESKRQSLYAALLRYSPEAGSLRERALDRIIMAALLGSSERKPFSAREIQTNIKFAPDVPEIRTEVALQTLARLCLQKMAKKGGTNSFYLTSKGCNELDEAAESVANLFQPVLQRMLEDTAHLCPTEKGAIVCRAFISQCFARFGQKIAKVVTGETEHDELIETLNIKSAFEAAIKNVSLSPDAKESLETRCIRFLRSTEPEDEKLKFRLTQGYYIAQLLGMDSARFNPISKEAFQGAIFYIDTNVLLDRIFIGPATASFDEVIKLASRLGIELRVTRVTIDETRWVGTSRLEDLREVIEKVPRELAQRTRDKVLLSYLKAKRINSNLTPDDFLQSFEQIPEILEKLGIVLDERDPNSIVGKKDISRESQIIRKAAETTRGYGKSDLVTLHDVCHFLLVMEERSKGNKAWFLSRDRTLTQAAVLLAKGDLPFCFPLVGLLQSISPFLESGNEENSLFNLFSAVLEQDVPGFPREKLFDLHELRLIGEFHEDVLSTPPDQLILAFDFIKSNVLDGNPYEQADHTKVALSLKKFLSSNADEKQKALQAEAQRLRDLATEERTKREIAENKNQEANEGLIDLRGKFEEAEKRKSELIKSEAMWRTCVMFLGALVAVGLWVFDLEIGNSLGTNSEWLLFSLRLFGSLILVGTAIPTALLLDKMDRIGLYSVVGALALGGLEVLTPSIVSEWSGYLAICAPVAVFLVILVRGQEKK